MSILTKKFFVPTLVKKATLIIIALALSYFYGMLLRAIPASSGFLNNYYLVLYSTILFYGIFLVLGLLGVVKKEKLAAILHRGTKILIALVILVFIGLLFCIYVEAVLTSDDFFASDGMFYLPILVITGLLYWAYRINKRDVPEELLTKKYKLNGNQKVVIAVIILVLLVSSYIWLNAVKWEQVVWENGLPFQVAMYIDRVDDDLVINQIENKSNLIRDSYNLAYQKIILIGGFIFASAFLLLKARSKE